MKKSLLILAAFLCLSFTGCSASQEENPSGIVSDDSSTSQISKRTSSERESSVSSWDIDIPEIPEIPDPEEFSTRGVITQTVIYDKNDVKITATGITYNNYEAELELNFENNTATDLEFRSGTMAYSCNSVNGYMVDIGYLNCDVAAGKKANDTINFSYSSLRLYGINEIADIEIGFDIDAADLFDDSFEEIFTGPCALKTSLSDSYDYSKNTFRTAMRSPSVQGEFGLSVEFFSDQKIYDSNGISVISEILATNKNGDPSLLLEVENVSPETVKIRTENIIVNGLTLCGEGYSYDTVNAGKKSIVMLNFYDMLDAQYWGACGLNLINSVEAKFSVFDNSGQKEIHSEKLKIKTSNFETTFNPDGTEIYNKNSVRIISKGFFGGEYDSDEDLYLILIAVNSSGKALSVTDEYDSLSVNGYMSDYSFYEDTIAPGNATALKIRLDGDSLKDSKIESVDDIQNVELTIKVRDEDYNELDKSVITINK